LLSLPPAASTFLQDHGIHVGQSQHEINHTFPYLASLEAVWGKLNDPRMAELQQQMAPFVVPGSHRWEVFRVQEG